MSKKTIRVSRDTWQWLRDQKRDDESFDDVLARLRSQDKWSGFGALDDTGIVEGSDKAHKQLEEELRSNVEETN